MDTLRIQFTGRQGESYLELNGFKYVVPENQKTMVVDLPSTVVDLFLVDKSGSPNRFKTVNIKQTIKEPLTIRESGIVFIFNVEPVVEVTNGPAISLTLKETETPINNVPPVENKPSADNVPSVENKPNPFAFKPFVPSSTFKG